MKEGSESTLGCEGSAQRGGEQIWGGGGTTYLFPKQAGEERGGGLPRGGNGVWAWQAPLCVFMNRSLALQTL